MLKEGRVVVVLPPLYGAKKGKKYVPIYDFKDVTTYKTNGYETRRYKGLGNHFAENKSR